MIVEISNVVGSTMPIVSLACFATSAFASRKFSLAAGYQIGGAIAYKIGQQDVGDGWNQASQDYWTLAKKDAVRDLTATAGFITLGIASHFTGKALIKDEKEESGFFDNIPVINSLWDNKKTVSLALGGIATYIWKNEIRQSLIETRNSLSFKINELTSSGKAVDYIEMKSLFFRKMAFDKYIDIINYEIPYGMADFTNLLKSTFKIDELINTGVKVNDMRVKSLSCLKMTFDKFI